MYMTTDITNCKVSDLVGKGTFKVTYAMTTVNEQYNSESVRLLLRAGESIVYGVNTSAKQIVRTVKDNGFTNGKSNLVDSVVVFKAYTTENGFTSIKMFINEPKDKPVDESHRVPYQHSHYDCYIPLRWVD